MGAPDRRDLRPEVDQHINWNGITLARCLRPPFSNVVAGDQRSVSMRILMRSFQSSARCGSFLAAPGSRAVDRLAFIRT